MTRRKVVLHLKRILVICLVAVASAMILAGCGTPLTAEFGISAGSARYGEGSLTVQFQDLTDAPVLKYEWAFGDGSGSTQANPQHTYSEPGLYDVTLTAWSPSAKLVTTKKGYIAVASPGCRVAPGGSIATVASSAPAGGIVLIQPGDYTENLAIATTGLRLVGEEGQTRVNLTGEIDITADNVVLSNLKINAPSAVTGGIIDITGAAGVVLNQVDLSGTADTYTSHLRGIAFYNSNGTVDNCKIEDVRLSAPSDAGVQTGFAITVSGTKGEASVTISGNTISGFQKQGITVDGGKVVISGNIITGAGTESAVRQSGIVLWDNSKASIAGNTISKLMSTVKGGVAIAFMGNTVLDLTGDAALSLQSVVDLNTFTSVDAQGYSAGTPEIFIPEQDEEDPFVVDIVRP